MHCIFMIYSQLRSVAIIGSVRNSHRSASPRTTTLEGDQERFVDFSSILMLKIWDSGHEDLQLFDWVSNTDYSNDQLHFPWYKLIGDIS